MVVEDINLEIGSSKTLSALDYVIVISMLVISAGIGFYHVWKNRLNCTLKNFLLAGGNMQMFPVAMSLIASCMSAVTLLGTPVEIYVYSTIYFYIGLAYILVMAGAAHIYVPIFYRLNIISVYEYLERRFSRIVRTAASLIYCIQMLLYMSIVLYAPSLAVNKVMGITLWGSLVSVGTVSTLYTAFGGMKAVLWTDCFQVGVMLAGLFAVLWRGSIAVGGLAAAWSKLKKSGRVFFDDFSPDPAVRHTFWSLVIGGYFTWVAICGVSQTQVQRAKTCPTLREARMALWLNVPGLWLILFLTSMIGVVMFAFYSPCDPLSSGYLIHRDQLLPQFVMDMLGDVTGLPGLFVACLLCGALSSISPGLNSLAGVVLEDVIKLYLRPQISDHQATRLTELLALVFGTVCLGLTYIASLTDDTLQSTLALFGLISGPLLGLFTLGMLFPWANKWGALSGLLSSLVLMFWIGIGAFMEKPPARPKPPGFNITGCVFKTLSAASTPTDVTSTGSKHRSPVYDLYTLSYLWYGMYAVLTVNVVGLSVSFLTGPTAPTSVDPKLICPLFDILPPFCFLPEKVRQPLRFGVVHAGKYGQEDTDTAARVALKRLDKKRIRNVFEHTLIVEGDMIVYKKASPNAVAPCDIIGKTGSTDSSTPTPRCSRGLINHWMNQESGSDSAPGPKSANLEVAP